MASKRAKASAAGLLDYLDGLARKLLDLLTPAFIEGDVEAIHDARVATRRLTAALRLFEPALTPKRYDSMRRTLRRLRRRLGELRDLDVMSEHLEGLKAGGGKFVPAVEWTGARLKQQRTQTAARTAKDTDVEDFQDRLGDWWAVREEIARQCAQEHPLLKASLSAQMEDFGGRAGDRSGDPHELRIAGKQLRYTIEMAKESGLKVPRRVPAAFKAMQDALGLWHDHVVLAMRVMGEALEAELAVHDPVLFHHALDLTREMTRRAELKLAAFHRLWEKNGGMMRAAVEELVAGKMPAPAGEAPPDEAAPQPAEPEPAAVQEPAA